jgi:hypothetical protein
MAEKSEWGAVNGEFGAGSFTRDPAWTRNLSTPTNVAQTLINNCHSHGLGLPARTVRAGA